MHDYGDLGESPDELLWEMCRQRTLSCLLYLHTSPDVGRYSLLTYI